MSLDNVEKPSFATNNQSLNFNNNVNNTNDLVNCDLTQFVVVDSNTLEWSESPQSGVRRRKLERDGGEIARATSVVQYDMMTRFPSHTHGGGEELFILKGDLHDNLSQQAYTEGHYVRHIIGSSHSPYTTHGCLMLVKLRQMIDINETESLHVDTAAIQSIQHKQGYRTKQLFNNDSTGEKVTIIEIPPKTQLDWTVHNNGEEWFVLDGDVEVYENNQLNKYSSHYWIRRPVSHAGHTIKVNTDNGVRIYQKTGHLTQQFIQETMNKINSVQQNKKF